jgi:hypothetical protein
VIKIDEIKLIFSIFVIFLLVTVSFGSILAYKIWFEETPDESDKKQEVLDYLQNKTEEEKPFIKMVN